MLTGKRARRSSYAESLLESRLVESSGCLKCVLSGNALSRALFNLKPTVEALHRLRFEVFVDEHEYLEICPQALLNLTQKCNRDQLGAALENAPTKELMTLYQAFKDKVRKGHLGKTDRFWILFTDDANFFIYRYCLQHLGQKN